MSPLLDRSPPQGAAMSTRTFDEIADHGGGMGVGEPARQAIARRVLHTQESSITTRNMTRCD